MSAIDSLLSYLEEKSQSSSSQEAEEEELEEPCKANEFVTAGELLDEKQGLNAEGPDIVDLFGEFDDDDDDWLNNAKIDVQNDDAETAAPTKGFSLGSSAGLAKVPKRISSESGIQEKDKEDSKFVSFGDIRITKLIFEPHEIERRVKSTTLITLSQIPWKIKTKGNKEVDFDWITFGVIISREQKTSKSGSSYTLMKLSDLKDLSKHVSLFLFGESHACHWKLPISAVVGLLNSKIMPASSEKKRNDEICSLTLNHPGHLIHVGTSLDLGQCKSVKKNGDVCNASINKRDSPTCVFHIQSEYKKMTSKRPELKLSYSGITPKSRAEILNRAVNSKETEEEEANPKKLALLGPVSASSFNTAIKRALTDPSSDEKNGTSAPANKKLRKEEPKKKMTKEEYEEAKKKRQELIDSYELRRKMETEMIDEALKAPLTLAAKNLKAAIYGITPTETVICGSKSKIDTAKGQRISLTGATNPSDVFKKLKPVEVSRAPPPKLGRGLKPGQDVTINFMEKSAKKLNSLMQSKTKGKISIETARKLHQQKMMDQKKSVAAKIFAESQKPEAQKRSKLEALKKRVTENLQSEAGPSTEETLSKLNDALNRRSKHGLEVKAEECKIQEAYFARLERKEEFEEKMASTTSIKVRGVVCATCKYIAESQTGLCLENKHEVTRKEVTKRFLACKKCNFQVVAYNSFLPKNYCPKCKSNEFKNSSMRPQKLIDPSKSLLVRGEEVKFLNSSN